jgi:hypothetical protein
MKKFKDKDGIKKKTSLRSERFMDTLKDFESPIKKDARIEGEISDNLNTQESRILLRDPMMNVKNNNENFKEFKKHFS